jgi:HK97 family phage prohead protease
MQTRFFMGSIEPLADREIGVVASTAKLGRDNLIVEPGGIDLTNFLANPIVLWQHLPDSPVGTAVAIGVRDGALAARIQFAPLGISTLADQVCSLVKASVLRGISIGFEPLEARPIDPKDRGAGVRVVRCELMEISLCSIPADTGAGVVERAAGSAGQIAFAALRPVPQAAIQRAAARVARCRDGLVMSPTMHVWSLLEARKRDEQRYSREARRAEVERLRPRY